jgi:hypothetical protein
MDELTEEGWPLDELRREIQKGIDDLDAGRASPGDEVFARLRSRQLAKHHRLGPGKPDPEALDELRRQLDVGIDEIERGDGIPGPEAVEQAREEFRKLTQ